jgi:hypothetical protein
VLTRRIATIALGAAFAALVGGCSALTRGNEITIAAEAIPPMHPPAPAAAPSPAGNAPAPAAPAQGG